MRHFAVFCLSAVALSACVSYDTSWSPLAGNGPYIESNRRAPAFQRCEQRLMDGARQCSVAFEDASGRKIEVFNTLVPQLDSALQSLPSFDTWPKANGVPVQIKIPYKLYLVTISPAIIVMVPSPPARLESCWVDAPRGTCLRSYVAFGSGYDLSGEVQYAPGSLWLVAGRSPQPQPIPDAQEFTFPIQGVVAKLVRQGPVWQFVRQ
jgi:hypothetical protein